MAPPVSDRGFIDGWWQNRVDGFDFKLVSLKIIALIWRWGLFISKLILIDWIFFQVFFLDLLSFLLRNDCWWYQVVRCGSIMIFECLSRLRYLLEAWYLHHSNLLIPTKWLYNKNNKCTWWLRLRPPLSTNIWCLSRFNRYISWNYIWPSRFHIFTKHGFLVFSF